MAEKPGLNMQEFKILCSFAGKWPPGLSKLSGLGFDSVSINPREAVVKKVQGADLAGNPHLFIEIRVRKDGILLAYSCPKGADSEIRRMQSTLVLLRVLRLIPQLSADMQSLSEFLLPAMESAGDVAGMPYESLLKKHSDLLADFAEVSSKNSLRLLQAEEAASRALELEMQSAALQDRARVLEAVSDPALREMVLEWLRLHRGAFNVAQFSEAASIPPARCEEGIEMLLKDGTVSELSPGCFSQARQHVPRQFSFPQKFDFGSLFRKKK